MSGNPTVQTACPYCGVGCGVRATPDGAGGALIEGDRAHPANFGRLCSKGAALGETLDLEGRLLAPRINGHEAGWTEAGWEEAIALVARRFAEAIRMHGPDSVAFYVSGQLLTEDYYVANKLMKGFIGSANIDTNSRLCMSSSVAGHVRAFGTDTVPGTYEDLEVADLVVLVGSNLAWCHPVLFQRIAAAKAARPGLRVVTIDPRRTATAELADMELRLAPGSDVAIFNGLLNRIEAEGAIDAGFVADHVADLPAAMAAARTVCPTTAARLTGLSTEELEAFWRLWIGAERVVTVYSQGVNQSTSGTDKVNAIINCHLATGRIGRPGMGPFSVTGQPNAMGGREVGGLANQLAAHLDLSDPDHRAAVQRFWEAPSIPSAPGLKAVDLFRACADGRIKALWIMSTNPAVSLPQADDVAAAIRACPFVAVSDIMADTDTVRLADVALPAAAWGEKSGTVTNSERRITRQRAFLPVPGDARPDWRIVCDVAAAMGWDEAFAYDGPAAIFREHAALSAVAADLGRDFDISALARIDDPAYDALEPVQWPVSAAREGGRFYADGAFHHADHRARMVPVQHRPPAQATTPNWPLRLNTGRVRDHWHTMTRTAKSARLTGHYAEPFVEIHPADGARAGIAAATLVEVSSPHGAAVVRALVTDRTPEGTVFMPMHWTSVWSSRGRTDALVGAEVDPVSGQPEAKAQPVAIAPFEAAWHGFALSRRAIRPRTDYWALARADGCWRAELAGRAVPQDAANFARDTFGLPADTAAIAVEDSARGDVRIAFMRDGDGGLDAVLFLAAGPVAVARAHVIDHLDDLSIEEVLAGRVGAGRPDPGPTVCSCFGVGANTIFAAIASDGLVDLDAVGRALRAGTNCGSCRPEISALLAQSRARLAAE